MNSDSDEKSSEASLISSAKTIEIGDLDLEGSPRKKVFNSNRRPSFVGQDSRR